MRIMVFLAAMCVLLSGCSRAVVWEQVTDTEPAEQVAFWQEEAYALTVAVPPELRMVESNFYETENGAWQVEIQTFLASDLGSAVRRLSGFETDRLTILQTSRFGLPEYRFAWYSQTAEGGRNYRADLVMDKTVCYAVVSSCSETVGNEYEQQIRQVFASVGLSDGEMV